VAVLFPLIGDTTQRNNRRLIAVLQARHMKWVIEMDIVGMARSAGLTVVLDGRIGREEYQSVCGSISALQRFAESLRQCAAHENDGAARRAAGGSASARLRRRLSKLAATPVPRTPRLTRRRLK
jgi:hypothetical protein